MGLNLELVKFAREFVEKAAVGTIMPPPAKPGQVGQQPVVNPRAPQAPPGGLNGIANQVGKGIGKPPPAVTTTPKAAGLNPTLVKMALARVVCDKAAT
jgi:hypothetical protein